MLTSFHSACHFVDWCCFFALHYYQYGWYVADVSFYRMFLGQAPEIPNRNMYSECGVPHFRICSEFQMGAYFVWRGAAVSCFTNREKNYLRVLIRTLLQSFVRDHQRAKICNIGEVWIWLLRVNTGRGKIHTSSRRKWFQMFISDLWVGSHPISRSSIILLEFRSLQKW